MRLLEVRGGAPLDPTAPSERAQLQLPETAVYEHNRSAFDAFFGVRTPPPRGPTVRMSEVPDRYGALIRSYERLRREAAPSIARLDLGQARQLGRDYRLLAYQIGSSAPHGDKIGVFLSAGIHGDETGAAMGLLEIFTQISKDPSILRRFEPIIVVPAVNPIGLDLGVREDLEGRDPNRQFWGQDLSRAWSVRALEGLVESAVKPERPFVFIDLHQDDRYEVKEAYALYGNDASRPLAEAAISGARAAQFTAAAGEIDGVKNEDGVLPKVYPGTFRPSPKRSPKNTRELVLEINDPAGFWPAVAAVLTTPELRSGR
ncbi:MAG: succinylglutamate desuccinylase/aspartoacylase family protein [Deltaproteobacteria bacterium]|nr:succinylglutamate desuccinylase/aspartoacylase family protein [Deltaproteobacteria bacterium]